MNNELFKAILSLDSYNRGYDAGIELVGSNIGGASITEQSNTTATSAEVQEGFYALAYDTNSDGKADTIAYRGTNYPADGDAGTLSDLDDWLAGGGIPGGQSLMAIEFYQSVVAQAFPTSTDYTGNGFVLTGHSLGGGLAGLVGAIYENDGVLFDNMAFENAAENVKTLAEDVSQIRDLVYLGQAPWATDISGLHTYSVDGEFLSVNRVLQNTDETSLSLGPDVDLVPGLDAVALHSMSTLVIRMYAEVGDNGTGALPILYDNSAKHFWPVLYDDNFAQDVIGTNTAIVSGELRNDNKYADILRTVIAYSAIDEGTRIFGDTGIRAFYNDANNFGQALLDGGEGNLLEPLGEEISKSFIQFAGQLALSKKLQADFPVSLNGALFYDPGEGNSGVLSVDFTRDYWEMAGLAPEELNSIQANCDLVDAIAANTGIETQIRQTMDMHWGATLDSTFDYISLGISNADTDFILYRDFALLQNLDFLQNDIGANLIVFGEGNDTLFVSGSFRKNSLIIAGDGDDTINAGAGNDIIFGGAGNDSLNGGLGFDVADYTDNPSGIVFQAHGGSGYGSLTDGWGDTDYITSIEAILGSSNASSGDDFSILASDSIIIDGQDGEDSVTFLGSVSLARISVKLENDGTIITGSGGVIKNVENYTIANDGRTLLWSSDWGNTFDDNAKTFSYQQKTSAITVNFSAATISGSGGFDSYNPQDGVVIYGTNHGDTYNLGTYSGTIYSGTGNDILNSPGYIGEYYFGGGEDTVKEGAKPAIIHLQPGISLGDITATFVLKSVVGQVYSSYTDSFGNSHTYLSSEDIQYDIAIGLGSGNSILFENRTVIKNYEVSGDFSHYDLSQTGIRLSSKDFNASRSNIFSVDGVWHDESFEAYTFSSTINSIGFYEYFGTFAADVISGDAYQTGIGFYGFAGNDTITGTNYADVIALGIGNDFAMGGAGADRIFGDFGDDTLDGGAGADLIRGGAGNDALTFTLSENIGAVNYYYGDTGEDALIIDLTPAEYKKHITEIAEYRDCIQDSSNSALGAGVEEGFSFGLFASGFESVEVKINGSSATIPVIDRGGENSDALVGTSNSNIIFAYGGDDTMSAGMGDDFLYGGQGNDTIYGGAGDDVLDGGVGYDTVYGEDGNDIIYFRSSDDKYYTNSYYGGLGTDTILFEVSASEYGVFKDEIDLYNYYLQGNADPNSTGDEQTTSIGLLLSDFEIVEAYVDGVLQTNNNVIFGTGAAETLAATAVADTVYSEDGDDIVYGGDGDDRLFGGVGNDQLFGQGGSDTLFGDAGDDILYGGIGDALYGGAGNDELRGYGGSGRFDGGDGTDKVWWRDYTHAGSSGLTVDLVAGTVVDGDLNEAAITAVENLVGSSYADTLKGDDNANVIYGGTDYNGLVDGDDTIYGYGGADELHGNAGNDTIYGGDGDDLIRGNEGNDILHGGDGVDDIIGDEGDDLIYAGAGDDIVYAGAGLDTVYGGDGNDIIRGEEDLDTLYGDAGSDYLYGYGDNDILNGGAGNDHLYGGDGDDTIVFGEEWDRMYGGAGADTFIAEEAADFDHDMSYIYDFDQSADRLDLSNLLGGYNAATDSLSDFINVAQGANTTFQVDRDGTGTTYGWDNVVRLQGNTTIGTNADQLVLDGTLFV